MNEFDLRRDVQRDMQRDMRRGKNLRASPVLAPMQESPPMQSIGSAAHHQLASALNMKVLFRCTCYSEPLPCITPNYDILFAGPQNANQATTFTQGPRKKAPGHLWPPCWSSVGNALSEQNYNTHSK